MQQSQLYSHHFAEEVLRNKAMLEQAIQLANQPNVAVVSGNSKALKANFAKQLTAQGWARKPRVHEAYNLTINALKNKVGFTIQTGNIARAFYDLLKFQTMYLNNRIEVAVLVVPTLKAANVFGKNVANFDRISNELELYHFSVTVPCLLLGFE